MNEPAAGRAARASHSLNLAAGAMVALLPGLWSFMWNLVWWPHGVSTLSNLCLSAQLLALGSIVCAHWVTFNFCQYDPLRDWLEQYAVRGLTLSLSLSLSFSLRRTSSRVLLERELMLRLAPTLDNGRVSCSSTAGARRCWPCSRC
jgi:hypothetical protein